MPEQPTVALVTAAQLPELDEDGPALLAALAAEGITGEPVVWDREWVTWSDYELAVVRCTWDYAERRDEFLRWVDEAARSVHLLNAAPVLRWNTDKRYLRDLSDAGAPVVPTYWYRPGEAVNLPEGEIVVKPVVSAGARDTARYRSDQRREARAHVDRLLADSRPVMVQPYVSSVDIEGETALLYLGGELSHAIRKGPILAGEQNYVDGGLYAEEDIRPRDPTGDEIAAAEAIFKVLPFAKADLLYARVDLVRDDSGRPMLLELELTEPSLFLGHHPEAPARLARAIAAALG